MERVFHHILNDLYIYDVSRDYTAMQNTAPVEIHEG
jgi:hypothetical protein